jgi:Transglycosylase associated protein.
MMISLISLLYFLLIGILAGFLASMIMKSGRGSMLRYLVIGAIGALLGGFLFRLVGLAAYGLLGELVMATVGAVILIFLLHKIR